MNCPSIGKKGDLWKAPTATFFFPILCTFVSYLLCVLLPELNLKTVVNEKENKRLFTLGIKYYRYIILPKKKGNTSEIYNY